METKHCNKCDQIKNIEEFSRKRGGRQTICKECHKWYIKNVWMKSEGYEKHKDNVRERNREYRLQDRINRSDLSVKQHIERYSSGECECCKREKELIWDHDHLTNKFRGYICQSCNTGMGLLGDNVEGLQKAIEYLTNSYT